MHERSTRNKIRDFSEHVVEIFVAERFRSTLKESSKLIPAAVNWSIKIEY